MIRAAGIDQARNLWMLRERNRDRCRSLGLSTHPQVQCFEALEHDPGVERRHRRTGLPQQHVDMVLNEFLRPENDPTETASLTVDVLGRGIDDTIGTERERTLPYGRREDVIDHQRCTGRVRDFGNGGDVDDLQRWIGWGLQKEHARIASDRLAPLCEINTIDERGGDAEARQKILHHPTAGAEEGLRRNNVISSLELPDQRRGDGRHPARSSARSLRALESRHAAFEHRHRWIGKSRV